MLQLSILPSLGEDDKPIMMTLGLPSTTNRSVHCGHQAPEIGPTEVIPVNTTDDGPQYSFSAIYNRVVVLREDQLGQENISTSPMQGQLKHTNFAPGQSLWQCTFNDTRLDGYMYPRSSDDAGLSTPNALSGASSRLPFKLKLVERKAAPGSVPYCQKVVVGQDGTLDDGGESVDLHLSKATSEYSSGQGDSDTSCQCQWVVG